MNRRLVALDQSVGDQAVADIGAGEDGATDQIRPLIDGQMHLVAEEALPPTPGEAGVGVARGDLAFVLGRPLHVGLDQARVDQRAGLHEQALRVELTVHLGKQALGAGQPRPGPDETGTPSCRRGSRHRRQTRKTAGTTADPTAPPPPPRRTESTSAAKTAPSASPAADTTAAPTPRIAPASPAAPAAPSRSSHRSAPA